MQADFSPDGKWLATACAESKVRIWRLADQKLVQTISDDEWFSVEQLAWLPNGKGLVIGVSGTLHVWGSADAL